MCTRPITHLYPATFSDRLRGITSPQELTLPCGKCAECMKDRQKSIRFRVFNEAKKRGTMDFLTLTYRNESLPIKSSMWSVDRDTGLMTLYGRSDTEEVPQWVRDVIVHDYESEVKSQMKSLLVKHPFSEFDDKSDYYLSYSPCHEYEDVKKLMKLVRKHYVDDNGLNSDFTFICVPEFGEHASRRPHYHLLFFGAPLSLTQMFARYWSNGVYRPRAAFARKKSLVVGRFYDEDFAISYGIENFICIFPKKGFIKHSRVNSINEDGSDGYAKVASYVGKYVGKGVFEDSLVKDGFVELPRISVSKHLGELPQDLVDWHLAKDMFGQYDDEFLSGLDKNLIQKIVEEVASRLIHSFHGYDYKLPFQFRKQIFRGRVALSRSEVPSYLESAAYSFSEWPDSGKTIYSALYYLVQDFVRNKHLQTTKEEFENYLLYHPSEDIHQAVVAFEAMRANALKTREQIALSRQRKSLQKSIF